MSKANNESIRRKLYSTLYRFGVINLPLNPVQDNIYIDDSGFILIIQPDGVIDVMGKLSFSGEFVCKSSLEN